MDLILAQVKLLDFFHDKITFQKTSDSIQSYKKLNSNCALKPHNVAVIHENRTIQ